MFKRTLMAGAMALLATTFVSQSTSMAGHHGTSLRVNPSVNAPIHRARHNTPRFSGSYRFHGPFVYPVVIGSYADKPIYVRRTALNPAARVLEVSAEQLDIGEAKAERRRIRRLKEADQRVYGFYSDREAYDVRFPSVVYLDSR